MDCFRLTLVFNSLWSSTSSKLHHKNVNSVKLTPANNKFSCTCTRCSWSKYSVSKYCTANCDKNSDYDNKPTFLWLAYIWLEKEENLEKWNKVKENIWTHELRWSLWLKLICKWKLLFRQASKHGKLLFYSVTAQDVVYTMSSFS